MTTLAQAKGASLATDRIAAILVAGFLGAALLWTSGFATPALLHNAAHDWRHAHNFPCH